MCNMKKQKEIQQEELNVEVPTSLIEGENVVEMKVEESLPAEIETEAPLTAEIEAEAPLTAETEAEENLTVSKVEEMEKPPKEEKPKRKRIAKVKVEEVKEAEEDLTVLPSYDLTVSEAEEDLTVLPSYDLTVSEAEEEPLPLEIEDVLLTDDHQEESADPSDEVAAEFDKELLSAKDQNGQVEEPETQAIAITIEEEIIPDYQSFEPEALIEALETLLKEDAFESIKGRVSAIKLAFLEYEKAARAAAKTAIHEAKEETEEQTDEFVSPLSERFNAVFDVYKQKKAKFMEDLEKEKEVNLERKNTILEELRTLLVSEQPLKVTYDRFRELQEQWKDIGLVPKQEIASLWNNYHFLIEKFFDKVRIHRELKELDLKKNLESKIALCEKAEELLLEEKAIDAFRKLRTFHSQWREIGAVPSSHREDIWERFKLVSDTIYQRHREYLDSLRNEYESNAHAKAAICEKTEEIISLSPSTTKEWTKKNEEINELFKLWKSIGPTGKKQSEELWERFRKTMNIFQKNKREYFQKIKEMSTENYNKKLNICVEAEALKDNTDWRTTAKEFVRMQEEWRTIGPVPNKMSEKLWKRFRAACDHFFNSKESYFSNITAAEPENLKAKEDLIEELKNCDFSGLRTENVDKLKDFQSRWFSIGFVPFKEKERLQTKYRQVLNEKLQQLNISFFEMNEGRPYRREENQNQQGRRNDKNETGLRKEIIYMQNRVATMQDEINLWENNIGFLSSSKNADILKQEFEKKIQKAKNDLELNVAKLKYLRQELAKEEENK